MESYELLLSAETERKITSYMGELDHSPEIAGERLKTVLSSSTASYKYGIEEFTRSLLQTKIPLIFAESHISGDGTDWNLTELSILGDISTALSVCIYDNGAHVNPIVHPSALQGYLFYVPGALLRSSGGTPCDLDEVTAGGDIDDNSYFKLYERRLLPVLLRANTICRLEGKKGFLTIPGIGCGQFAGQFIGYLGHKLNQTIKRLLAENYHQLDSIEAVYYDPYKECANERENFGDITYFVRPLTKGNNLKSQLCSPGFLQDSGDDFYECLLLSVVAWDHVSWPGNDYYNGDRVTDDGVKAAATDTMYKITGIDGTYCEQSNKYLPPEIYSNWQEVVNQNQLAFGQSADILTL